MSSRAASLAEVGELRTVISAGGDGTASLISRSVPSQTPITLYPLGSENLLAKHFGIRRDIEQSVALIQSLNVQAIDRFETEHQSLLLMASAGYDADVVRSVHQKRTSHISRWNYWQAIGSSLISYPWPEMQIDLLDGNGNTIETHQGNWVFMFNIPRYAAGLDIIPEAIVDDGLLDIGIFRGGSLATGLWHYMHVLRGTHTKLKSWVRRQAEGLRIGPLGSKDADIPYQIDGDFGGKLPVTIRRNEHRMHLVIPLP